MNSLILSIYRCLLLTFIGIMSFFVKHCFARFGGSRLKSVATNFFTVLDIYLQNCVKSISIY